MTNVQLTRNLSDAEQEALKILASEALHDNTDHRITVTFVTSKIPEGTLVSSFIGDVSFPPARGRLVTQRSEVLGTELLRNVAEKGQEPLWDWLVFQTCDFIASSMIKGGKYPDTMIMQVGAAIRVMHLDDQPDVRRAIDETGKGRALRAYITRGPVNQID